MIIILIVIIMLQLHLLFLKINLIKILIENYNILIGGYEDLILKKDTINKFNNNNFPEWEIGDGQMKNILVWLNDHPKVKVKIK